MPQPVSPAASNAARQALTVTGVTPLACAFTELATPPAAANSTLARCTSRCAAVRDRDTLSNISRWFTDITNGAAGACTQQYYQP